MSENDSLPDELWDMILEWLPFEDLLPFRKTSLVWCRAYFRRFPSFVKKDSWWGYIADADVILDLLGYLNGDLGDNDLSDRSYRSDRGFSLNEFPTVNLLDTIFYLEPDQAYGISLLSTGPAFPLNLVFALNKLDNDIPDDPYQKYEWPYSTPPDEGFFDTIFYFDVIAEHVFWVWIRHHQIKERKKILLRHLHYAFIVGNIKAADHLVDFLKRGPIKVTEGELQLLRTIDRPKKERWDRLLERIDSEL